jgi:polyhydroxybutyrate depolymerase
MPGFTTLKTLCNAALRGSNASAGPALVPVPGTIDRPEGTRHYLIAAPGADTPAGRPLVVILHGGGASAEQVLGRAFPPSPLSVFLEIGAREGLVVAAPDAGKGGWSGSFAGRARAACKDDVAFIGALIDCAVAQHGVDPARVYLIGVSSGGFMAYQVALEMPHRLAAFSSVLAGMRMMADSVSGSVPIVPLPVLVAGCTADPMLPYAGGKYWYTPPFVPRMRSIEDTVRLWRELAKLPDTPRVERIPSRDPRARMQVTCSTWGDAPDGLQVGLIRIDGAGHAEPSRLKRYPGFINRLVGAQNGDVEIAELAWAFFRHKRTTHARPDAAKDAAAAGYVVSGL